MIVLSLVLVIVAAVTLIAGFFEQESLTLIWVSIGSCIAAMVSLGIGVRQRQGERPARAGVGDAYGPGATGVPTPPVTPTRGRPAPATGETTPAASSEVPEETHDPATDTEVAAGEDTAPPTRQADPSDAPVLRKTVANRPVAPATADGAAGDAQADDELTRIKGVGPATRAALLARFGSVDAVRRATAAELAEVKGVGPALARRIEEELGG